MLIKSLREMAPWIRRILISPSSNCSTCLHKTSFLESISIVFFSTSRRSKTGPKVTIFDYLVDQQQFSPESASNVPSSSTKYLRKPRNAESVLNFLRESGFTKTHIQNVVQKVPQVLSGNPELIKPKVKILQDLGFEFSDVAELISAHPWILTSSAYKLFKSISILKSVMGSNTAVCRLLKISGWFLTHDLERIMMPNIEYLQSCGISSSQIVKYVFNFPRFFLVRTERIKGFVKRVDAMGVDRKSKMFLPAIRVVSCMASDYWDLKWKFLRELGFSEDNLLFIFRRTPQAFGVSEKKIKEAVQLILSVENLDYIVGHPELLMYSVDQRLKPRLRVLKVLESENLLRRKPNLSAFFKLTNAQFVDRYVNPYLDVLGDSYVSKHGSLPKDSVLLSENP